MRRGDEFGSVAVATAAVQNVVRRSRAPRRRANPGLHGSHQRAPLPQNPAESRDFQKPPGSLLAKSLPGRTQWRSACGAYGGRGSLQRTRLCGRFPDEQGKYREILADLVRLTERGPEFSTSFEDLAVNSLRSETGNRSTRTGKHEAGARRAGSSAAFPDGFMRSSVCRDLPWARSHTDRVDACNVTGYTTKR